MKILAGNRESLGEKGAPFDRIRGSHQPEIRGAGRSSSFQENFWGQIRGDPGKKGTRKPLKGLSGGPRRVCADMTKASHENRYQFRVCRPLDSV